MEDGIEINGLLIPINNQNHDVLNDHSLISTPENYNILFKDETDKTSLKILLIHQLK